MSDAAASDDSDLRNITHAGTPLTATSLAIAERTGASGQDVLAAMVLGYEVAGRIGESITPGFRQRGFHACLVASFNAVAAAGLLLKLDVDQMTHAIALNATSVGGLIKAADTSVAREYDAGLATMLGIDAAMAAQKGFTGEADILEMPGGFCATYGGTDAAGILADWGAEWDIITDMAIKLVPGSHFQHSMAEAAANAARKGNITAQDIASITLSRLGMTAIRGPRHPENLIRHGAQRRVFHGGRGGGSRIHLGARDAGKNRRPGYLWIDRQGPNRAGTHGKYRRLPAGRDRDH